MPPPARCSRHLVRDRPPLPPAEWELCRQIVHMQACISSPAFAHMVVVALICCTNIAYILDPRACKPYRTSSPLDITTPPFRGFRTANHHPQGKAAQQSTRPGTLRFHFAPCRSLLLSRSGSQTPLSWILHGRRRARICASGPRALLGHRRGCDIRVVARLGEENHFDDHIDEQEEAVPMALARHRRAARPEPHSQRNKVEGLHRPLLRASACAQRRLRTQPTTPVLRREDEGRQPQVRKDEVDGCKVAPVRLHDRHEHRKHVYHQGDDGLPTFHGKLIKPCQPGTVARTMTSW